MTEPRRSERTNIGKPPSYLRHFDTSASIMSGSESEGSGETVRGSKTSNLSTIIAQLTSRLTALETDLAVTKSELHIAKETNNQLQNQIAVQQNPRVTNDSIPVSTGVSISAANCQALPSEAPPITITVPIATTCTTSVVSTTEAMPSTSGFMPAASRSNGTYLCTVPAVIPSSLNLMPTDLRTCEPNSRVNTNTSTLNFDSYQLNEPAQMNTLFQTDNLPSQGLAGPYCMPPAANYVNNANLAIQQHGRERIRKLYDLPDFTGKPEEWPMFLTSFRETTAAYGYSNLENMIRLQKSVKGEAKEVVECLLIHPNNVQHVIAQLEFRFGRAEHLIRSQLNKVRELADIPENRIEQLIPFATKVQNLTTFLESTNSIQHIANPTLLEELVSKLPISKRLEWAQASYQFIPYVTIRNFSDWLSRLAIFVSLMTPTPQPVSNSNKSDKRKQQDYNQKKHVCYVNEDTKEHLKSIVCPICEKDHHAKECPILIKRNGAGRWDLVKEKRLCFGCLKPGHGSAFCKRKIRCELDGCKRFHHKLLHESLPAVKNESTTSTLSEPQPTTNSAVLNCQISHTSDVLFKILPVKLYGMKGIVETFAIIDEGSSITMMESSIAEQLGLEGADEELTMKWVDNKTATQTVKVVSLHISGNQKKSKKFYMTKVYAMKNLTLPTQTLRRSDLKCHEHILHLPNIDYSNVTPRILIGVDNCHLGISKNCSECSENGPIIANTKLGWVVYGPSLPKTEFVGNCVATVLNVSTEAENDNLHRIVTEYLAAENFGTTHMPVVLESDNDRRARKILSETTVRTDERFETGLLWKSDGNFLPESKPMAIRRLLSIEAKMRKDSDYAANYRRNIDDYVRKGYARKLSKEEEMNNINRIWYLPHFGVQNPNKPGKFRIVFDAAAKVKNISLNSELLKGPDENQPLLSVLCKFREKAVAICGDIEEMFSQIRIRREDQDAQRFLWRDGDCNKPMETYVMQSMTFGATCSPCSAQHVKNINALEMANDSPRVLKAIIERHYVDDYVDSFDDEHEALSVISSIINVHRAAGFNLRKFVSNSKLIIEALQDSGSASLPSVNMDMESQICGEKILGMYWNTADDIFCFQLKFHKIASEVLEGKRPPSKREVLSVMMSIFDPFGILANFTIYSKIIMQEIWKCAIDWDESISNEIYLRWDQWRKELERVPKLRIPRCYSVFLPNSYETQLHIFVDASESAFAAVAYLRTETTSKQFEISLIAGKTKCAPLKLLSIPRLELQSAVLGTRLRSTILENHDMKFDRSFLWSDSKTVLNWLNSDHRRYKPFVAHRIAEILDTTEANKWRWIPSKLNPADDATRATFPVKFEPSCRWVTGPDFLKLNECDWPRETNTIADTERGDEEIRRSYVLQIENISKTSIITDLCKKYSKYKTMKRVMAWILRYLRSLKVKSAGENKVARSTSRFLTAEELQNSELQLCHLVQTEIYPTEIEALVQNRSVDKSSEIWKLNPHLGHDGVMRISGRIDYADCLPASTKRPIILPRKHKLTELIVLHYHEVWHHQNNETILAEIRRSFWIPSVRTLIKQVKANCQICKIGQAESVHPQMGQIPVDRLIPYVRPFSYTGLDFFGPITVKVKRSLEKRWVALFTCLTTRAVHLEIATDLSADSCILCIRNFVNLRGNPIRIRSDNGTNFIRANKELQSAEAEHLFDRIGNELSMRGIQWIFNIPGNPHTGGCWERLVQSVKRVLSYTLKEEAPHVETLRSLILEAANIINSRPLTFIALESDAEEPLTPNHFLLGTMNSTQSPNSADKLELCSRKQWRIVQQLRNRMWKKWVDEYLPNLLRREKWQERIPNVKVDDLVLITDSKLPRSQWKKGRIVKVFEGKDGQVRGAEVRTASSVLKRPVCRLAVLDVKSGESGGQIHEGRNVEQAA